MVEKLTERNLQLEERIEALEEEKNDLVTCSCCLTFHDLNFFNFFLHACDFVSIVYNSYCLYSDC